MKSGWKWAVLTALGVSLSAGMYSQVDAQTKGKIGSNLSRKVTKSFKNASLSEVLAWLKSQGVDYAVRSGVAKGDARLTLNVSGEPLQDVLRAIGKAFDSHWELEGNIHVLKPGASWFVNDKAGMYDLITPPKVTEGLWTSPFYSDMPKVTMPPDFYKQLDKRMLDGGKIEVWGNVDEPAIIIDEKDLANHPELKKQIEAMQNAGEKWTLDAKRAEEIAKYAEELAEKYGKDDPRVKAEIMKKFGADFQFDWQKAPGKDFQFQFDKDFGKEMEAWGEKFGKKWEEMGKKWEAFGQEWEKKGAQMEKEIAELEKKYGKDTPKFKEEVKKRFAGKDFQFQMDPKMQKELEAQMKALEKEMKGRFDNPKFQAELEKHIAEAMKSHGDLKMDPKFEKELQEKMKAMEKGLFDHKELFEKQFNDPKMKAEIEKHLAEAMKEHGDLKMDPKFEKELQEKMKSVEKEMAGRERELEKFSDPKMKAEMEKHIAEAMKEYGELKVDPRAMKELETQMKGLYGKSADGFHLLGGDTDLQKFAESLTDDQKRVIKKRGYLIPADLTTAQRKMIKFPAKGDWSLTFSHNSISVTIKNK